MTAQCSRWWRGPQRCKRAQTAAGTELVHHRAIAEPQRQANRRAYFRTRLFRVPACQPEGTRISRVVQSGGIKSVVLAGLAKNGQDALRLARATRPEVVTMDLTMPEMDGFECGEALLKFDPAIWILVVSALSDKSTAIHALKLGARGLLPNLFPTKSCRWRCLTLPTCDREPPVATLNENDLKLFVDSIRIYLKVTTRQEPLCDHPALEPL